MARVSDGLPAGYEPGDVFILGFPENGKLVDYYVNCDGVKLSELGKVAPTPEQVEMLSAEVSTLKESNADAQAEIERLRNLVREMGKDPDPTITTASVATVTKTGEAEKAEEVDDKKADKADKADKAKAPGL